MPALVPQSAAAAPAPPAPPAPPAAPGIAVQTILSSAGTPMPVPQTRQELRAVLASRKEYSDQLRSVMGRREEVIEQIAENADNPTVLAGLNARLAQYDERILQIERDIADVGRQVAAAPLALQAEATTAVPTGAPPSALMNEDIVVPLGVVFTMFVLAPLGFSVARLIWKRAVSPPPPKRSADEEQRLARIEQAVDAIAIEVERISEGQRFVTKALAAGAAQPVAVPQREAQRVAPQESAS